MALLFYINVTAIAVAILLGYLYPNHELNPLLQLQSGIQASLKPAQWIPSIRDLCRHSMDIGSYSLSDDVDVVKEVTKAIQKSKLIPKDVVQNSDGYTMKAWTYTPTAAWLDIVELRVVVDTTKGVLVIHGVSESTGVFPLLIPAAPVFNVLFCWVPFSDHGNNERYLTNIQKNLKL